MAKKSGTEAEEAEALEPTPVSRLRDALLDLDATRLGFEGLVGGLVEIASGGRLRLMSSGDQQGVDALADPQGSAPRRAMQAKRYAPDTPLSLSALLGEMDRAARRFLGIDSWILATTRALLGKEADELRDHSEALGWKLISLDWSGEENGVPPLAALCAAHPEVVLRFEKLSGLKNDLIAIAEREDFPLAKDAVVAQLNAADAGFPHLREAAAGRLGDMYRDRALARRLAGPSPSLLAEAPPVQRNGPLRAVTEWQEGEARVLALLGNEGQGKTWSALEAARALQDGAAPPLVLTISSKTASKFPDALEAVVAALGDLGENAGVRVRSAGEFWRARLSRWAMPAGGARPAILLLVDGLDELDPFDWDEWLAPILEERWRTLFRLLVTCRGDDWHRRVTLRDLRPDDLLVTRIGNFEPDERDEFLRQREIDPGQISPQVRQAALHPRTAFHLTRLAAELPDLRRVTREQLLLRDFSNRWDVKGGVMRPEAFESLVRAMARDVQGAALRQAAFNVSEGEVVAGAAGLSGYDAGKMRSVVSDLVSSDWFRRDAEDQVRIEFSDERLPDAVGMALAAEIRGMAPAGALAAVDRFLEPWGADDIVEKVLRTCATVMITEDAVPDALCSALLERWFAMPFHGDAGQDFWRRLHVFRPELFLRFAEGKRYGHEFLLEWGIACLWDDHPESRALLEPRLEQWLTILPLPEEVTDVDPKFARYQNADRTRQLGRCGVLARRQGGWGDRIGREREGDAGVLMAFAARTIGFLPRTPFVPLISQWAITVAAVGRAVAAEEMGAVIRENATDHDEAVAAIRVEAARLAAAGAAPGRRAAAHLLRLTGLHEDAVQAGRLFRHAPAKARPAILRESEREIGLGDQGAAHPRFILDALVTHAPDPDVALTPELQETLRSVIGAIPVDEVEGWFRDWGVPAVLTRWVPDEARVRLTEYLAEPPGEDSGKAARAEFRLVALCVLPILDTSEREAVARALEAMAETGGEGRDAALSYRLSESSFEEQVDLLLAHGSDAWPTEFGRELLTPTTEQLDDLLSGLAEEEQPRLRSRLLLAGAVAGHRGVRSSGISIDWPSLVAQASPDLGPALRLALNLEDIDAARALAATSWNSRAAEEVSSSFEGSELLALLPDEELRPVLSRLEEESLLRIYGNRAALRPDVGPLLLDWLRGLLLTHRSEWAIGGSFYTYGDRQACFDALFHEERSSIKTMLRQAWGDPVLRRNIETDHGGGPVWPLLRSMWGSDPDFVHQVWRGATDHGPSFWVGEIEVFPSKLPRLSTEADLLRVRMLERCNSDDKLFDAVTLLQRNGHEDMLIAEIRRLAGSARAVDRARAFAIAAFMDPTEQIVELWSREIGADVLTGWEGEVQAAARRWHREGLWARHWWRALVDAGDEYTAWGAYARFVQIYDVRFMHFWEEAPRVSRTGKRARWLDRLIGVQRAVRVRRRDRLKGSTNLAARTDRIIYRDR